MGSFSWDFQSNFAYSRIPDKTLSFWTLLKNKLSNVYQAYTFMRYWKKKKIFIVFDAFLIYFQFSKDLGMKVLEDMAM